MRNEQEIMELVLQTAQQDDRIRAVTMNGSRSDPNAAKDRFQDYDIVFFVTELSSFLSQPDWIDCFGERVILQTPEDMELFPPSLGGWFTYLMLFEDLNRIDLMLIPVSDVARYAEQGEDVYKRQVYHYITGKKVCQEKSFPKIFPLSTRKKASTQTVYLLLLGAGYEARTRYLHLGKVALYQMS